MNVGQSRTDDFISSFFLFTDGAVLALTLQFRDSTISNSVST